MLKNKLENETKAHNLLRHSGNVAPEQIIGLTHHGNL